MTGDEMRVNVRAALGRNEVDGRLYQRSDATLRAIAEDLEANGWVLVQAERQ